MWIVRYIENEIGKTQATLITFIFLIPGADTFVTFVQVPSSMYYALFGITQDPSVNPYIVTKFLPLSLGWTFVLFNRNITESFTPAGIPIQRTVIENLDSLNFFIEGLYFILKIFR